MDDEISKIPGAGGKKGETLVTAGISKVCDLKQVANEGLPMLKEQCPGISLATLTKWRDHPAHDGTCPHQRMDYRTFSNPYLAKYGEDEWQQKCEESVFMRKYMCVKELVTRIHDGTRDAFVGTHHEDDWFFYHDALS